MSSAAAVSTRSRSSPMLDDAIAFPRDASAISQSSPAALAQRIASAASAAARPSRAPPIPQGGRALKPLAADLVKDAALEELREKHGIAKPPGDRVRLGEDRGLLGSAPDVPQAPRLRAQSTEAQDRVGVGARQVQGSVDPVHGIGVAVSRQ